VPDFYPVSDSYDWEIRSKGFAGFRVDGRGTGTAGTATQVVQADNIKSVGIKCLAGADAAFPPAGFFLFIFRVVVTGRVVITTQGMADEDGIGLGGIEPAIGFHHQVVLIDYPSTAQLQRFIKMNTLGCHDTDRIRWNGFRHKSARELLPLNSDYEHSGLTSQSEALS